MATQNPPLLMECVLFVVLGIPIVLGGFMFARWIGSLSPEGQGRESDARFLGVQKRLFLGRTPLGHYRTAGRNARFRFYAAVFRWLPVFGAAL